MLLRVQRLYNRLLLFGQHATEHVDVLEHARQLIDVLRQLARIHGHRLAVAGELDLTGDRTDRHRVVAGDDAAAHALFTEPRERRLRVVTDMLGAQHDRHGLRARLELRVGLEIGGGLAGGVRDEQHAHAVVRVIVDLLEHVRVLVRESGEQHFRRAHVPHAALARFGLIVERDRAPFARARERHAFELRAAGESLLAEPREHGTAGAVRAFLVRQVVERLHRLLLAGAGGQCDEVVVDDAAVGDRAGLVEVEAVDARERLHRVEVLHKRVLAREPDRREREVERGEQHEAFRHHAHHAGDRRDDRLPPCAARNGRGPAADGLHLCEDEQDAQRHHEERHELEDRVDALVEVGDVLLVHLRLRGECGGVAVRADRGHVHERHAGHCGRAGVDGVALLLAHGARFAGDHRLVEFEPPRLHDRGVRGHLLSRPQPHEVAEHNVVVRNLHVVAVAAHEVIRGDEDRQFVERVLCAQLGDDADARVDDDDEPEDGVLP